MSNAEHSHGKWTVGKKVPTAVYAGNDSPVCICDSMGETLSGTDAANARRIVACVNACRGLGTDELEQHGLVSAVGYELIELTKQRDELLRDMQDVLDMLINQPHAVTAANQAEDMLRLSIGTAKYFAKAGSENHSPDIAKMVVQEGWQLVPVEPTIEMVQAATHSAVGFGTRAAYQAMLVAAPKPAVKEAS